MSLSVFLCHASEDKPAVRELYEKLQRDGFDPWLDEENLLPGQDWKYEISRAVRNSHVVLVCLSDNSVTKTGFVQKEIRVALDVADEQPEGAIFIIPAKLEECDVPDRLSTWQWVNIDEAGGYERLVAALLRRAIELGIDIENTIGDDMKVDRASLYDEEETLEGDTHMTFPCELEEGEKINIDLRSDEAVDVLIMDEGDYKEWDEKGEVNMLYKEFLERDQLHAFFTAPESDTYLVIVRNNSDDDVEIKLKITYAD
jgi:TIR domain